MATKRILLIDDEPGIRQVIQVTFKVMTPWEVLVAESCKTGLAIAEAQRPDAILLDVMMPEMDGITALHQMQENPVIRSIPTILLTAKAQARERERFSQLPIAGVITKPFKAQELVKQIRSILQWQD
ncbi:response regulator [Leptolyngbya ohadii]|uniref:response regulator n=1 Tax=Leptolyngbya ohadii TaxID=1962290 RepID=UPI000B59B2E7|nr:response regulator [Leptolyngbya ohadii]